MRTKENRLRYKLGYGIADLYGGGAFLIISILFIFFMTEVVGMNAALAGSIPFIGRTWDAITDPFMGALVDRTRSKYGAKRFFILIGSFVAAFTFMLVWVSIGGGPGLQYLYYLLAFMLFSTGFTIVMVPYNALLPDMVHSYHLRGQYTGIRMVFSALSAILGALLPEIIIGRFGPDRVKEGYLVMGIVFGFIFLISLLVTFFNTFEDPLPEKKQPKRPSIRENVYVFKNRAFRMYLGIFLFGQGSVDFILALILYFLTYVLVQPDQYITIMAGVLGAQLFAMVLYQFLLKYHSKKVPIYVGIPLQILATVLVVFFAYEGAPIWPIVGIAVLLGFGTAASTVTPFAILTDLADVDELISTQRRAGMYAGMATFSRKIANGVALGLVGLSLWLFGFDSNAAVQSDLAVFGIVFVFVAFPLLFLITALFFTARYPLNNHNFPILKAELLRRRADGTPSDDPAVRDTLEKITGYPYEKLWRVENVDI
ncbi:MAG: MFS transporter [Acholeplasmatales bacterium]|nr:MAG: MFS transporter [Acholeplasmatales bacterium]